MKLVLYTLYPTVTELVSGVLAGSRITYHDGPGGGNIQFLASPIVPVLDLSRGGGGGGGGGHSHTSCTCTLDQGQDS